MNKTRKTLAIGLVIVILVGAIFIMWFSGMGRKGDDVWQVENFVETYYERQIEGNYEDALDMLQFTDDTMFLRDAMTASFEGFHVKAYNIKNIEELASNLYQVDVEGVMDATYDQGLLDYQKGVVEQSFAVKNYVIYNEGEWRFCISNRFVPKEIYDFPDDEIKSPFPDGEGEYIPLPFPDEEGTIVIE